MENKLHLTMPHKHILVTEIENPGGLKVGMIQLNRPDVLNALNIELMKELVETLETFDIDSEIGCMVITGSQKAFAAGADINEMAEASTVEMIIRDQFATWDRMMKIKKPVIASVSGYALGGGCELAMSCDMIFEAEGAKFGQPEINLGIIPGAGGTQRLTRAIGKVRAMEMIITGKMFSAKDMFEAGLVTAVYPDESCLEDTIKIAKEISNKPTIAVQLAKECILKAFNTTIEDGIQFERRNFYLLFSTEDKVEGMKAFVEKRKPVWKNK